MFEMYKVIGETILIIVCNYNYSIISQIFPINSSYSQPMIVQNQWNHQEDAAMTVESISE